MSVLESTRILGSRSLSSRPPSRPTLLIEIPHGATRLADFEALRGELAGSFPADLEAFFCVNTDVGAPELALAIAFELTAVRPELCVEILRCRIPRTFIDCNRVIERTAMARASAAGEMTSGLHEWITHPSDRARLLEHYFAYKSAAEQAYERVMANGGRALMLHSYAPRSIDVCVDSRIVERLREEYRPERIAHWPLRPAIDLIDRDPQGVLLADQGLADNVERAAAAAGWDCTRSHAYALHPVSLAHHFAARFPGRTLCLEVRRDLLVEEFRPFEEMRTDPSRIQTAARLLSSALSAALPEAPPDA
jgi:hypothetical protein